MYDDVIILSKPPQPPVSSPLALTKIFSGHTNNGNYAPTPKVSLVICMKKSIPSFQTQNPSPMSPIIVDNDIPTINNISNVPNNKEIPGVVLDGVQFMDIEDSATSLKSERIVGKSRNRNNDSLNVGIKEINDEEDLEEEYRRKLRKKSGTKDGEVVFVYNVPCQTGKKELKVQLTKHDIKTLEEGQLINDAIIVFYLKLIQNELLTESQRSRVYIFDTYFMVKFREKWSKIPENDPEIKQKRQSAYLEMKKWTKNVDLVSKDFIVFPIHDQEHWSLIIACYPSKWFEEPNDSSNMGSNSSKNRMEPEGKEWQKPCIIALDSLESQSPTYHEMVKTFVEMESAHKNNTQFMIPPIIPKGAVPFCPMLVPRQNNPFDCGIYLMQYAELFLTNPEVILRDLENLDRQNWFPNTMMSSKREDLKALIYAMKNGERDAVLNHWQKRNNTNQSSGVSRIREPQTNSLFVSTGGSPFTEFTTRHVRWPPLQQSPRMQTGGQQQRLQEEMKMQIYLRSGLEYCSK